jgi:glycosyltransferase involved in cell wall biosynthesis
MLLFANKLIFTNEFERTSAIKKLSCVKSKSTVIRIFSNIPQSANIVKLSERTYDIGCFGYIRPLKGIENFIETVASLKKIYKEPIKAYILGETWPELQEYTTKIRKMADEAGIVMMEGRSDSEVADILADTKIAYLPYPDGLSERRGSFLAFVRNLALIVSTEGPFVTEAQRANLKVVKEDEAAAVLNDIFSLSAEELNEEQDKVEAFVKNELPSSWNEVVEQYNSYINN